mgnify:CR=1 FL=1
MNTSIILIFAILSALTIGFYIGKLLSKTQSNAEKSNLDGQLTSQTNQLSELKISFQSFEKIEDVESKLAHLLHVARNAVHEAYNPYSNFCVGCAVQLDNGQIITGFNIETIKVIEFYTF